MNRLRDTNIRCRKAESKEDLTEGQAVDRLAFATGWRDFDWGSVILTDETSISSDCASSGHVYREPGTRYDTRYIHVRSGRFSIEIYLAQKNIPFMNLNETTSENALFRILHNKQNFPLPSTLHRPPT